MRLAIFTIALMLLTGLPCPDLFAANERFDITVVDKDTGLPIPCRMHLVGPKKKPFKPEKVPFWNDHFVVPGKILLKLPVGNYTFVLERGAEYLDQSGHFTIENFADDSRRIEMRRFIDMAAEGWWSGDLDVRRPLREIELLMGAEDLHVAEVVTWRNDKKNNKRDSPSIGDKKTLVQFDGNRFYDPMAGAVNQGGTELLLFQLSGPLKLPGEKSEYPPILKSLMETREKGPLWVDAAKPFGWDLPMLVAAGQIDSIQIANNHLCRDSMISNEDGGRPRDRERYPNPWGNAQWSQFIYFQLLECGLRIPPSAGSGSGESPNPVGYNRMYVHVDGDLTYEKWWESLRAGRVFVTNGPLLKPSINGQLPGHVFQGDAGQKMEFEIGLSLSTREPISYLEIIKNGKVEHSISFDTYSKSGKLPKIQFDASGWFLIRAVTDIPKTYRFAMTGPYYVEMGYKRRISKSAAQFFLDWVYERAKQIKLDDPQQQEEVLRWHRQARDYWKEMVSKATAE
jgi:hypothetical protein